MFAVVVMRSGLEQVGDEVGDVQAVCVNCVVMVGCGYACMCLIDSLEHNDLGSEGGAAIGAGLCHVPSLTTLEYVRWAEGMGGDACVCMSVRILGSGVLWMWVCSGMLVCDV
jgi:hypothetical protein